MKTIQLSGAAVIHQDEGPFEFRSGDHSLILRFDPNQKRGTVIAGGREISLQGELVVNPADITPKPDVYSWGCQNGIDEPMRDYCAALQRLDSSYVSVIYTVTTAKIES